MKKFDSCLRVFFFFAYLCLLAACSNRPITTRATPTISTNGNPTPASPEASPGPGGMSILQAAPTSTLKVTAAATKARIVTSVSVAVVNLPKEMTANLRSGAGENFSIVGSVHNGAIFQAVAITSDHQWLQLNFPAGPDGKAWIFTRLTDYSPSLGNLLEIDNTNPTKVK